MKKILKKTQRFDSLSLRIASPEDILSWSFGEVTKPETINYRTQRSERDGLFCEKIFGPENNFQCSCGKYKGAQYQGIECSNCGVEVTNTLVRRERMGHVDLAAPIAHFWYLRKIPSRVATMLGLPSQQVQNVVYFSAYYISSIDEKKRKKFEIDIKKEFDEKTQKAVQEETQIMLDTLYQDRIRELKSLEQNTVIDESTYERMTKQFPGMFKAEKGGEVIYKLLKEIDIKKKEKDILKALEGANKGDKEKLQKQLLVVRSFIQSGNQPEWMFLTRLPVIPPGIRPVVPLDGGRYASSDLNDLYRHVIVRNNRLKEFIETKAPEIFINTQKRLLQEAVDALFEKSTTKKNSFAVQGKGKSRQLKSISEYLGRKSGYFRLNLLGKRVDFTGRSVIVTGAHLKLNEFGLPKKMALEIFRPFIIGEALDRELAYNVRGAQRLIDTEAPIIWEMLEKVMEGKYMLLNRAPTLHRQSIQAFKPILTEGLAIEINPLVCSPFNADFDGDCMVLHLPLSEEAQVEAKNIIVSSNNIVSPASGEINVSPAKKDVQLGCYWATKIKEGAKGEGKYFGSVSEAITAHDFGVVDLHAKIKVLASSKEKYGENKGKLFETTVGRLFFNVHLPKEYPFINKEIGSKELNRIIKDIFNTLGREVLVQHLDSIKDFGFKYASKSGITFSLDDLKEPSMVKKKKEEGREEIRKIDAAYTNGYISLSERKEKSIDVWHKVKAEFSRKVEEEIAEDSSIGTLIKSGARGSYEGLGEMVGMFGIVDSASGEQIEQPVLSSLKDGMNSIEYFNASFGARKGLADTALKTAGAGFLSRKLFSVAQEIKVEGPDCGTKKGFRLYRKTTSGVGDAFNERIRGRFVAKEVIGDDGSVLMKKNQYIDLALAEKIESIESIESIVVRSPITCKYARGICVKCYGDDRTTREVVDVGEPVGTIAAQSIGEPGTQLTMRTFHAGGVATVGGDITTGLPRVTEIFERRIPKAPALIAHTDGIVEKIESLSTGGKIIHLSVGTRKVSVSDRTYAVSINHLVEVSVGTEVKKGQFLTDGSADLQELLKYSGKEIAQEYIFSEIGKIYELQGVSIAPAHFEIIIRQMFSQLLITDPGEATYTAGEFIEYADLTKINEQFEKQGKKLIEAEDVITGITNISVSRNNFLSAASFQNTTSVLIRASINGAKDTLDGVKENVIVGRLVPIGSGHEGSKKFNLVKEVRDDIAKRLAEKEENKT